VLNRRTLWRTTSLEMTGSAAMIVPTLQGDEQRDGGLRGVHNALTKVPLSDLAPALGSEPDALVAKLKAAGFSSAALDSSIEEIAEAAEKPPRMALEAVAPEAPAESGQPGKPAKSGERS